MRNVNAIMAISYRDLMKLLRDPVRLVSTLIFPVIFIGIMGGSFESNLAGALQYSYMGFIFTGIFAQTLFQSAAIGVVSLIEDRENDFSQEMFVAPVSRYAIVFGKILGETYVSLVQGVAIIVFAVVIGVPLSLGQLAGLGLISLPLCLFGGAFGVIVLANLNSQRAANQIFPFIMMPQYFLAGVFTPVKILPWYLDILSHLSPMRYAVDLTRNIFYAGQSEYDAVVIAAPLVNTAIVTSLFVVFLVLGTWLFVRGERNR
jgi:ABC-2 type transport system permease protein